MHEKLEEFISKKQAQETRKTAEQKNKLLMDWGLCEKIYSPDNRKSPKYPESEFDANGKLLRYKIEPINITNDEYELLKKYISNDKKRNTPIAIALDVIAYLIFIAGFIAGITFGGTGYEFNIGIAVIIWCGTLVSGILVLAVAEIIRLLTEIKNK